MTSTLTAHVADLAECLAELRCHCRRAARLEVGRVVGGALRELTLAWICGPATLPARASAPPSRWEDPWEDPADDPWHASVRAAETNEPNLARPSAARLPTALMAGLDAARWGFSRTRQLASALLIGLLVALAAYLGGPTLEALLEAWTTATDLLSHPGAGRRP
jgi:hypothetical protein